MVVVYLILIVMDTLKQVLRLDTDEVKFCTLGKPGDSCTVAG